MWHWIFKDIKEKRERDRKKDRCESLKDTQKTVTSKIITARMAAMYTAR